MLTVCSIIQGFAALYILWRGLIALNSMNRHTRGIVRFSYLALAVGAMASVASCFVLRDLFQCVFVVAVAVYLYCNKRVNHA